MIDCVTSSEVEPLAASTAALAEAYDVALLDLDGVVYVGSDAVRGAAESLAAARAVGMRLAFVTNNAARPPVAVARHLTELGVDAEPGEVVTSAQAAARYLGDLLQAGAPVLVVGTTGLDEALTERGLRPVRSADDDPVAVVQGYSPTLDWALLAEGCIAIRRGLPWVATNIDPTVPSPRGPLPGNGSLVAALRYATGAQPVVTGKPDPAMHRESVRRSGARSPIVVGDRLDTDIEGANAVGCPSLLVLTGVTDPTDLLRAEPRSRPTYLSADLAGLLTAHPGVAVDDGTTRCGAWQAAAAAGGLELVSIDGRDSGDGLDALRALCAAAWWALDSGAPVDHLGCVAGDDVAGIALERLALVPS
ncbi:MAG: glycerol-phosphatase [Pseudonocardiales bacterium]|jgi:HAD superfamily hydrolase (TIGR01450 family)|nr:glycerol-phosphatase [Pseudonocardiales bacterium]